MPSSKVIKKYKLDADSLKALFTADKKSKKIQALIDLVANSNKEGINKSLNDYRTPAAIDLAYDAPFHQETPTILRHILSSCNSADEIRKAGKAWGINEKDLFCECERDGKKVLELNTSAFADIHVPVVRSYHTVRTAKLFNDRNRTPLLPYSPIIVNAKNRIRCEIVTNWVQARSVQMGTAGLVRQAIHQSCLHSICLAFPQEPWFEEKQENDEGKDETVREGIRHVTPHITRTYYDLMYPLSTLNTDTGCAYAGYWDVAKFGDIFDSGIYWNKDEVTYGTNWLDKQSTYRNYFEQAYPCVLEFPNIGGIEKETDRTKLANYYSPKNDRDRAVFLGYQFRKIVPKDWGMGTYKHPVWFRFLLAGHDTILHCEPWTYRPTTYCGYDADQNRGKNVSLAQEIIPSQDLLTNLLTQIFLTVKRNLSYIILYDTNMEVDEQIKGVQNRNQWVYQTTMMVGYDSTKFARAQIDPRNAFIELKPTYQDTSQMMGTINIVISMLERLLVISPQEIGSSASHQQSKAEVVIVNSNTTNRVAYTGTFVDEFIEALKRQQFEAMQAHGGDEVLSEVSADIPELEKHLKELGFEITEKSDDGKKMKVKGKKSALKLEGFASNFSAQDKTNDIATAQAMYQAIMSINQNQAVAAITDPTSILELMEQAAKLAGADDDFKIRLNKDALKSQQLQQTIEQIKQLIMGEVEKTVAKPAAEAVSQQEQEIKGLAASVQELQPVVAKLLAVFEQASQAQPPIAPQPIIPNDPSLQPA